MIRTSPIGNCHESAEGESNARLNDESSYEDEEIALFRKVLPAAHDCRGRSIPMILYDRSILGNGGIDGHRFSQGLNGRYNHNILNDALEVQPSPSSVIHDTDKHSLLHSATKSQVIKSRNRDSTHDNNKKTFEGNELSKPKLFSSLSPSSSSRLRLNSYPTNHSNEIRNFGEHYSVTKFEWSYLNVKPNDTPPSSPNLRRLAHQRNISENRHQRENTLIPASAVSTISIAFSPDGRTIASTHGDHTVKISCCHTGKLIRDLRGHSRTPWTVKYHPSNPNIVASGCLGFQVRIWDWNHSKRGDYDDSHDVSHDGDVGIENNQFNYHENEGILLNLIRLDDSIISLSFHPSGSLLAIASGTVLRLWDWENAASALFASDDEALVNCDNSSTRHQSKPLEKRYDYALRCVYFPPDGDTIILGGLNTMHSLHGETHDNRNEGSVVFLGLWDFNLEVALHKIYHASPEAQMQAHRSISITDSVRDCITNFQMLVPRALLYNDGGFDVSPDGKSVCVCAEYWLPPDFKNAMECYESLERTDSDIHSDDERTTIDESKRENYTQQTEKIEKSTRENHTPIMIHDVKLSIIGDKQHDEMEQDDMILSIKSPSIRTDMSHSGVSNDQHFSECRTPPNQTRPQLSLSPPAPPCRRITNFRHERAGPAKQNYYSQSNIGPPPPSLHSNQTRHLPIIGHVTNNLRNEIPDGRYVPHVAILNLDSKHRSKSVGHLMEASPLDGAKASGVTCVKFSPSTEYCILGYGVRENKLPSGSVANEHLYHPVVTMYRIRGGLVHVTTMLSGEDDVNIAMFHPVSGHGFVYGTKQGRLRVLGPRPWNYYKNVIKLL